MKRHFSEVDFIIRLENGQCTEADMIDGFQRLIDSGTVWRLQGSYGRMAAHLIKMGKCKGTIVKRKVYKAKTKHCTKDGYRVVPNKQGHKIRVDLILPTGDRYVCEDPDVAALVIDGLRLSLPKIKMPKLRKYAKTATYYRHPVAMIRRLHPERLTLEGSC